MIIYRDTIWICTSRKALSVITAALYASFKGDVRFEAKTTDRTLARSDKVSRKRR